MKIWIGGSVPIRFGSLNNLGGIPHANTTIMIRTLFLVPTLLCLIVNGQNEQTFINALWHGTTQTSLVESLNSIYTFNNLGGSLHAQNFEAEGIPSYSLQSFDALGNLLWQSENGNMIEGLCSHSLLLDNGKTLIGGFNAPVGQDGKSTIAFIETSGQESWSIIDDELGYGQTFTSALAMGIDSTIWHSCSSWNLGSGMESRLQQYSIEGELLWSALLDGLIVNIQAIGPNARVLYWSQNGSSWEGHAIKFNSQGTILGQVDLEGSVESPDSFCAWEQDYFGNSIVVCKKNILNNVSVLVWSLSDSFELNWTNTFSVPGIDLSPQAVAVNDSGNIFVSGSGASDGVQKMMICDISSDGNLNNMFIQGHADGLDMELISASIHGDQFVGHLVSNASDAQLIGFRNDKIIWSREIESGVFENRAHLQSRSNKLFQTWTDGDGINHREALVVQKVTNELSPLGEYMDNQLVIKFDPSFVDETFVENKEVRFGRLTDVVGQTLVEQLSAACGIDLDQKCTAVKIYPGLTEEHHTSISRDGRHVKTPSFWSCFRLVFEEDIDELAIAQLLGSASSSVRYCEVNPVIHQMNEPNDPMFSQQTSLAPYNDSNPNETTVGMGMVAAWEYATGSPLIKVGVFDDVLYWAHEDFGDGTLAGSVVKGGHDFVNGLDLEDAQTPGGSHGTAVGGIIGAKRDNGIGISGIAGGDEESPEGVSLYSMGIFSGNSFVSELSTATQAIVEASFDDPESDYGYGLHIQNHSWGTGINTQLLADAIEFAWLNNSIVVAARGNSGTTAPMYPACYGDDLVISVGACDESGTRQEEAGFNLDSSYGQGMDILAPGIQSQIWTVIYAEETFGSNYNTSEDLNYSSFNNTSAAAAHISGVASLAFQTCTENTLSPVVPSTEDVEKMIQFSGKDPENVSTTSYDNDNAWGWLNASYLLSSLSMPVGFIHHFDFNQPTEVNTWGGANINLQATFENLDPGLYTGELVEYEASQSFDIPNDFELHLHWARPSATWSLVDATMFDGDLHSSAYEITQQGNQVTVQSNFEAFHITSDAGGNPLDLWIPTNPSELRAAYSAYFHNPGAVNIEEKKDSSRVSIYPVPSTDLITIIWNNQDIEELSLYNSLGQIMQSQTIQKGSFRDELNISALAPGTYVVVLRGTQIQLTTTFIKTL
jgi:thermitase